MGVTGGARVNHLFGVTPVDGHTEDIGRTAFSASGSARWGSEVASAEEAFRRLTIGDPEFVASVADRNSRSGAVPHLDPRTSALMRIAALVAADAPASCYRSAVTSAQLAGARLDDLIGVLVAIGDDVGSARVISAAPRIALAAGYDVEADLE